MIKVKIRDLSFSYKNSQSGFSILVPECDFDFEKGLAIYGSTGSGKTTFAKLMGNLLIPDRGEVQFSYRREILDENQISYSPQFPEKLFFLRKIEQTVNYIASYSQTEVYLDRFKRILNQMGLDYDAIHHRYLNQFSGGEIRVIALSMILAMNVRIYLFDEPFIGLSESYQNNLMHLFKMIQEDGRFIVIISHEWESIEKLADKIVILEKGRLAYFGALQTLIDDEILFKRFKLDKYEERRLLMMRKRGKF